MGTNASGQEIKFNLYGESSPNETTCKFMDEKKFREMEESLRKSVISSDLETFERLVAEIFGENTSKEIHQRIISLKRSEGIGLALVCGVIIFGTGITLPPIGVAWPCLIWIAEDALGGARCLFANLGYVLWGPCFGLAIPFIGLEVTGIHEGKPVFAIYGFALLSVAIGENVSQFP